MFPGEYDRVHGQHMSAVGDGEHISGTVNQTEMEDGSSYREETFVAVFCRITDESNLDL